MYYDTNKRERFPCTNEYICVQYRWILDAAAKVFLRLKLTLDWPIFHNEQY